MHGSRDMRTHGLVGAIALYLGLLAAVFVAFSASLYWLLQPSIAHNPGLTVYEPPPATVLASAPARAVSPSQTVEPTADLVAAQYAPDESSQPAVKTETVPPKPAVATTKTEPVAPVLKPKVQDRRIAKRPPRERTAARQSQPQDPRSAYAATSDSRRSWTWSEAVDRGFLPQF